MNRRDFLKQGVAVGVASAAASGCATAGGGAAQAPGGGALPDMDAYLARLDRDLQAMEQLQIGPQVAALLGLKDAEAVTAALNRDDAVVRQAAKALYLTSAFRDLPEEGRAHPGVQRRLWAAAPDMTAAVDGMRERLRALSAPERARLQRGLKARPELMDALCRTLDSQVSQAWVQPERRVRQRMVMSSVGWRMQHQSLSAVIDQFLEKADRARAWSGAAADVERRMMAQMGQEAFWASRDQMVAAARRWEERRASLGGGADVEPFPPSPAEQVMSTGLTMMGIGAVTGVVGLLLMLGGSYTGGIGMVGTTIGGAVLLAGILVWLVGAAMNVSEDQSSPPSRSRTHEATPPAAPPPEPAPL